MKTTELVVTKCKECPFSSVEKIDELISHADCLAPVEIHYKYNIDNYYKNNTLPTWCPLKKTDLLITFKK